MLIAIEGIDGSGKTTISKYVAELLRRKGYDVLILREPSNSKFGRIIRSLETRLSVDEELKFFYLDRIENVKNNIIPALSSGKVVVMDRYYFSNIAYQSARGIDGSFIRKLNEKIAPKPDLVILLDVKPEIALSRISTRKKRTPFEELDYLKKVREKFLELSHEENVVIINANADLEEVKKRVKIVLCSFLSKQTLLE